MKTALNTSLTRLETMIDGSIAALTAREFVDDRGLADAKGRALLELSRISQRSAPDLDASTASTVARLKAKLDHESRLLALRLDAAQLIATLVSDAVMAEEWDGTYDPRPSRAPEGLA